MLFQSAASTARSTQTTAAAAVPHVRSPKREMDEFSPTRTCNAQITWSQRAPFSSSSVLSNAARNTAPYCTRMARAESVYVRSYQSTTLTRARAFSGRQEVFTLYTCELVISTVLWLFSLGLYLTTAMAIIYSLKSVLWSPFPWSCFITLNVSLLNLFREIKEVQLLFTYNKKVIKHIKKGNYSTLT